MCLTGEIALMGGLGKGDLHLQQEENNGKQKPLVSNNSVGADIRNNAGSRAAFVIRSDGWYTLDKLEAAMRGSPRRGVYSTDHATTACSVLYDGYRPHNKQELCAGVWNIHKTIATNNPLFPGNSYIERHYQVELAALPFRRSRLLFKG